MRSRGPSATAYRLNVFPITIPPLRERGGDVVLLAEHFLATSRYAREPLVLGDAQRAMLCDDPFPGNVRELQDVMERAAITARGVRYRSRCPVGRKIGGGPTCRRP